MNVHDLDPEVFNVWPYTLEGEPVNLIVPAKGGAVGNKPWTPETIQFRSRVETFKGETVSEGFKKFFNLGTGPEGLNISVEDLVHAASKGDAVATLKLDGSLLIRSVFKGKVILRTRGSIGYEHLDNADEMDGFRVKYPALFDPDWYDKCSLLFEWVSPRNVIVLKYPEPEITLIGGVVHDDDLPYLGLDSLNWVAKDLNVPLVESFKLTPKGWADLNAKLDSRQDIEGYVIRLNGEQDLVKVKCAPYLTKHALKSKLDSEQLVDMWFQQGEPDFKTFSNSFIEAFDEETYLWALGAISALFDGVKEFKKILIHMQGKARERHGLSRKDAALQGLSEYGQTKRFSAYMNLWEGKPVKPEVLKSILLQSMKQVELGMFKPTKEEE